MPTLEQHRQNDPSLGIHAEDVAEYFLVKHGSIDAWALEKLTYYVQAWSLAWDRGEAFPEDFEAWKNGPVIRSLFVRHRGLFSVETVGGRASLIDKDPVLRTTIEDIWSFYGNRSGDELSDLTHSELPWKETRRLAGAKDGEPCNAIISKDLMRSYYKSIFITA